MPKTKKIIDKSKNQINVIYPYRTEGGSWVYDDLDIPVVAEAFVCGSSELIDMVVGEECNNFTAYISEQPIPEATCILDNIDEEKNDGMQGWYRMRGTTHENWFCSHLNDYVSPYASTIYVKIVK